MSKITETVRGGEIGRFDIVDDPSAVPIDSDLFFRQGSIELHHPAPRGNDTRLNKKEAAALTQTLNEAPILRKKFMDGITPLFRKTIRGQGMVQIMVPSSPYAYGGVMVVSVGNTLMTTKSPELTSLEVPTETAFDLGQDMRCEYYRQILASIQAEEDIQLPRKDTNSKVIAFENTVVSISNEQHRLPRTIVLPHMHIIKGGDWINGDILPPRTTGFRLEQRISQDRILFTNFRDHWFIPALYQSGTSTQTPISSLELRGAPPYGYTIGTGITRDESLDRQSQKLSDLLHLHHDLYAKFAEYEAHCVDQERAKRREDCTRANGVFQPVSPSVKDRFPLQPSYRTYLYYRQDELAVTISPILITTLGAMEGMATAVNRSACHEKMFSDDEIAQFFTRLTDRIHALLEIGTGVTTNS